MTPRASESGRFKDLLSFRSEGRPSLQMVIAVPAVGLPHTYAEFDLDLANPLQDIVGFVFHVGELLNGKETSHLDLRRSWQTEKPANSSIIVASRHRAPH